MYKVSKRMEIAGAHRLLLDYPSPCCNIHGHNWIITVHCASRRLNSNGMVIDFAKVKDVVHSQFDHSFINDKLPNGMNPTAENMAYWISALVSNLFHIEGHDGICYKVLVQESEGNIAIYENEDWEEFV